MVRLPYSPVYEQKTFVASREVLPPQEEMNSFKSQHYGRD